MKKLVLFGDSIRMGCQHALTEMLEGKMEVYGPNENGRWSGYTLNSLRFWIPDMKEADVIHWNNGLWDMGDDYGFGRPFTRPADYKENLELIIQVLRKNYPDAKIIMATTTPTLDRDQQIIRDYNEILKEVAKENDIPVNDLYAVFAGQEETYVCPDKLHLTKEGFTLAAEKIIECVEKEIGSI